MFTRALAVAAAVALAATMGPGVASTAAQTSSPARISDGDNLRPRWVPDGRDGRVAPEFNADGIKVYPRAERGWLFLQVAGDTLVRGRRFNAVEVHLQTRGDSRPDYRVVNHLSRDGDGLSGSYIERIRRWESPGRGIDCPRLAAHWEINRDTRWVEFAIPRRCIQRQGRVRVNTETWNLFGDGGGRADAVPRTHTLSRWI